MRTWRVGRMVMHWFRKPAGESPYRFEPCTLRFLDIKNKRARPQGA